MNSQIETDNILVYRLFPQFYLLHVLTHLIYISNIYWAPNVCQVLLGVGHWECTLNKIATGLACIGFTIWWNPGTQWVIISDKSALKGEALQSRHCFCFRGRKMECTKRLLEVLARIWAFDSKFQILMKSHLPLKYIKSTIAFYWLLISFCVDFFNVWTIVKSIVLPV